MAAIDLECPKCGATGSIPRNKINTRLVCKKCRAIFHVNPLGRSVLGEPQGVSDPKREEAHPARPRDRGEMGTGLSLPKLDSYHLAIAGGVVLVLLLGYGIYKFFNGPDEITPAAQIIANSIALDSPDFFRPNALPGTEAEAMKFFDATHTALSTARSQSPTKSLTTQVLVESVTEMGSKAEVLGVFKPTTGFVHEQQIAGAANDQSGETKVMRTLWLAKDPAGTWKLDGRKTLETQPAH
jgi:hypothetical protein